MKLTLSGGRDSELSGSPHPRPSSSSLPPIHLRLWSIPSILLSPTTKQCVDRQSAAVFFWLHTPSLRDASIVHPCLTDVWATKSRPLFAPVRQHSQHPSWTLDTIRLDIASFFALPVLDLGYCWPIEQFPATHLASSACCLTWCYSTTLVTHALRPLPTHAPPRRRCFLLRLLAAGVCSTNSPLPSPFPAVVPPLPLSTRPDPVNSPLWILMPLWWEVACKCSKGHSLRMISTPTNSWLGLYKS